MTPAVRFTAEDAGRASEEWGANCGPGALAAILGLTLDDVRPLMDGFEGKGYTNPTQMFDALEQSGRRWHLVKPPTSWPEHGLVRVQWEGPWTVAGVPMRVRYRHTHWVGSRRSLCGQQQVFDINCIGEGGWVPLDEWARDVVPWILRECQPKANGKWHLTHVLEVPA